MMDVLPTLFQWQNRRIGLIVPSAAISEEHNDSLEVTEYPIKVGAAISDRVFRRSSKVVTQVGFAGGGSLLDFVNTSSPGLGVGVGPKETYQELLDLQSNRMPSDVMTGEHIYTNMLIRALEATTDRTSENILSAMLTLREVIITSTTTTHVAPKSNMKLGVNVSAM